MGPQAEWALQEAEEKRAEADSGHPPSGTWETLHAARIDAMRARANFTIKERRVLNELGMSRCDRYRRRFAFAVAGRNVRSHSWWQGALQQRPDGEEIPAAQISPPPSAASTGAATTQDNSQMLQQAGAATAQTLQQQSPESP